MQLVWFLAGIYATGALWFFLSRDEYVFALLSALATVALTVVAIQLHRVNDRGARFREFREKLAAFAGQASSLSARAVEEPLPINSHNEWIASVDAYLRENLDESFVVRFGNFSGMTFYGDGSPKSNYKNSLDGRTRRLHEFIRDFSE